MNNLTTAKRSGIKWGPFTMRIPFIHIKFRAPEFLQGLVISGATAFAAAPLAMKLGLTFEEAIALSMVAGIFISSGPLIFGEPMAPGWVTPAVPIVMGALAAAGYYGVLKMVLHLVLMGCANITLKLFSLWQLCALSLLPLF